MSKLLQLLEPLTPSAFDKNEVFIILISFLVWGVFLFLHKRTPILSKTEIISLYLFNLLFATVGDRILAEPPIDFYDTVDYPKGEFFDSVLQIFVFPMPIIISFHFFVKTNSKSLFYIILWACILTALEWISVTFFNLFQYKNWNTWYSFLFYIFTMTVNTFYYRKIRHVLKSQKELNS